MRASAGSCISDLSSGRRTKGAEDAAPRRSCHPRPWPASPVTGDPRGVGRPLACNGERESSRPAPLPSGWRSLVPGIELVTHYQREWLAKDVVAGLVLSALLVPQGMAYAELAGLPPVTGLYTSILCLIGYAIFGPSRVLVLGPDSALGSMIAATIAPLMLANGDPARAIALASLLAIFVGVIMVVAGSGQVRLHRRPAVQADPDRLHERAGPDHRHQPAAEAARLLGGRRRPAARARRRRVRASSRERPTPPPRSSASPRWSASCC